MDNETAIVVLQRKNCTSCQRGKAGLCSACEIQAAITALRGTQGKDGEHSG